MTRRHTTRDFRGLAKAGGRELELVGSDDEFPPDGGAYDTSEGSVWNTSRGWYVRNGDYWEPIYEPHAEGALEAAAGAGSSSLDRESRGWEGEDVSFNAVDFLDYLAEAGWAVVRVKR